MVPEELRRSDIRVNQIVGVEDNADLITFVVADPQPVSCFRCHWLDRKRTDALQGTADPAR